MIIQYRNVGCHNIVTFIWTPQKQIFIISNEVKENFFNQFTFG